ncbi:MAG TPA: hypothetical protein VIK01_12400 [Polyangiaceae bacterium]
MKHLIPCPECNRHVRVSELECPFCALPLDLANTPPPQLPRSRLSRAATLAFGATLVSAAAISACSEGTAVVPPYGAAPGEGAGAGAGPANGGSGGSAQPSAGQSGVAGSLNLGSGGGTVYGGPPSEGGMGGTIDLPGAAGASGEAGAGAVQDGGGGNGGGPFAVYGGPP